MIIQSLAETKREEGSHRRAIYERFTHTKVNSIPRPCNIDIQPLGITKHILTKPKWKNTAKNVKQSVKFKSKTPVKELEPASALLTTHLETSSYFPLLYKPEHNKKSQFHTIQHDLQPVHKRQSTEDQKQDQYIRQAVPGPGAYTLEPVSKRYQPDSNFDSRVSRFSQQKSQSPDKYYDLPCTSRTKKASYPFTRSNPKELQRSLDVGYYETRQNIKDDVIRNVIRHLRVQKNESNKQQRMQRKKNVVREEVFNILHNPKPKSFFTAMTAIEGW